jgi:hypothetical protein
MDDNGLTADEVAARLSDHLGREVKPLTVNLRSGKAKTPPEWAQVLGLDTSDDGEPEDVFVAANAPPTEGAPSGRAENDPPRKPAGTPTTVRVPAGDLSLVRERIAKAYSAMGAGASMITQNQGYGAVSDAYSNEIAAAWVAAAKENQNVAKIVAFLDSGGPVGELIIAHLILVGGWVYVSGRGPALDFLYAGKFDGYRRLAISHGNTAAQDHAADEGFAASSVNGATYPVGDSQS